MSQGEAAGLGAPAETQPRAEPAAEAAHLRPFALLGSELGTLFRRRRTIAMLSCSDFWMPMCAPPTPMHETVTPVSPNLRRGIAWLAA